MRPDQMQREYLCAAEGKYKIHKFLLLEVNDCREEKMRFFEKIFKKGIDIFISVVYSQYRCCG